MMMRVLFAAVVLFGISACASTQAPERSSALIDQGRRLTELHCARCHAVGVSGESPLSEAPAFRTLSQRHPVNQLEEAFAEGVLVGHPAMPEFRFEPEQIDALTAYLESIQTRRAG